MIDIHSHILFGVDDGAQSVEDSLGMALLESEGGTRIMVTTPHVMDYRDLARGAEFQDVREVLNERFIEEGIDLRLVPGAEVYPFTNALKSLDAGESWLTLGGAGKYVLVDTPLMGFANDFDVFLGELKLRGISPILAHPERAGTFLAEPSRLESYRDQGILLQVNVGSLFGKYGPMSAQLGLSLLRQRKAQFVASDLHRPPRKPALGSFAQNLPSGVDADYLEFITVGCPRAAITGNELPFVPAPPALPAVNKARWFSKILGRR